MTGTHKLVISVIAAAWGVTMWIVLTHIAQQLEVLNGWPVCHH